MYVCKYVVTLISNNMHIKVKFLFNYAKNFEMTVDKVLSSLEQNLIHFSILKEIFYLKKNTVRNKHCRIIKEKEMSILRKVKLPYVYWYYTFFFVTLDFEAALWQSGFNFYDPKPL